jgi:hypothetical protein
MAIMKQWLLIMDMFRSRFLRGLSWNAALALFAGLRLREGARHHVSLDTFAHDEESRYPGATESASRDP